MDSNRHVRHLVERALAPEEWTSLGGEALRPADDDPEAERLLARWQKLLAPAAAGPALFERRLEHLGLDRNRALARLGRRALPEDVPLPSWAQFLAQVLTDENFARPVLPPGRLEDFTPRN
jgi:hypothetical protein